MCAVRPRYWKIARQNVDLQASTVAQLQASLKVDEAAIHSARLNLTYARITAPPQRTRRSSAGRPGNVVTASTTTGLAPAMTQLEPIAVVFTLPEDELRIVLLRIREHAVLPVDVFDRAGSVHLASGSVVTLDNQIDR